MFSRFRTSKVVRFPETSRKCVLILLSTRIKNAKVGNLQASTFVREMTKIELAHFQKKALDDKLKGRAETSERELDLQRTTLGAVTQQLKDNLTVQLD